jgi:hypothetical protein
MISVTAARGPWGGVISHTDHFRNISVAAGLRKAGVAAATLISAS